MSGGKACECSECKEPIEVAAIDRSNRPGRLWRVTARRCNYSAFNGYHRTWSAYSAIQCLRCGAVWRTKASYVDQLKDRAEDEENISSGYARHAEAMAARGREPHR